QRELLPRGRRRLRRSGDGGDGGEHDGEGEGEFHAAMVCAHRGPLKRDAADRTRRAAIGTRGGMATSTPTLSCGDDRDQYFQEKNCEDIRRFVGVPAHA